MVEALELISEEGAFGLDVEHQPSARDSRLENSDSTSLTRQSIPSSAPQSRKRRLFFVAAPVCLLALCCVVVGKGLYPSVPDQAASVRENTGDNEVSQPMLMGKGLYPSVPDQAASVRENTGDNEVFYPMLMEKGPYFDKLTTYQSLTGKHAGGIEDVIVQDTRMHREQEPTEELAWPSAIPFEETFLWRSGADIPGVLYDSQVPLRPGIRHSKVSLLTSNGPRPKCVRFLQEAMHVLLGSLHGTLPGAPVFLADGGRVPLVRTWDGVAAAAFGAWLGGSGPGSGPAGPAVPGGEATRGGEAGPEAAEATAAAATAAAGTAAGWLASELLEGRAMNKLEPLVLNAKGQQTVAQMDPANRSQFLSKLAPGWEGDAEVLSAYPIIVELFFIVRELTRERVPTVLDVGEVFSGQEFAKLQKKNFDNATRDAAVAADGGDLTAEARRSGPRFLLRCLLLLEKFGPKEKEAAAEFLRKKLPKALKTPLLPKLKGSKLKIWRGGPTEIDGPLLTNFLSNALLGLKFNQDVFLGIIGANVATERKDARRIET